MALGIILNPMGKYSMPAGINYTYGGVGVYEEPFDPYFNRRGEAGFYSDTMLGATGLTWWQRFKIRRGWKKLSKQAAADRVSSPFLGAIPTDFDIATVRNYTPVQSAWINTNNGYIGPHYQPGQPVFPLASVDRPATEPYRLLPEHWNGLGDVLDPSSPATVEDVMGLMNAHNDRVFALTLVSTAAVAVSAMITVFRTLKLLKTGG